MAMELPGLVARFNAPILTPALNRPRPVDAATRLVDVTTLSRGERQAVQLAGATEIAPNPARLSLRAQLVGSGAQPLGSAGLAGNQAASIGTEPILTERAGTLLDTSA